MEKLEYQVLKCEGLSKAALEVYGDSDPLAIYKDDAGVYHVKGIVEFETSDIKEIERSLLSLGGYDAE